MRPVKQSAQRANQIFFWALTGDYHSLRSALESGMSVNVIDPVTTDSPLMIACRKGNTDIVRLCLEYGAKNDPHPEFGQTALHASVAENQIESARVLLSVAADSDADHIISNLSDPSGQTSLHTAAYLGSTAIVELLLQHGAAISSVDSQGQTPLHLCASSGVKPCLAMLLDHGGDDFIDVPDGGGNTALHHASYHGRLECVRLLLETAADVMLRNHSGQTPYNIASAQGHHQIGLLLLEYREHHSNSNSGSGSGIKSAISTPMKPPASSVSPSMHHVRQSYPPASHAGTPATTHNANPMYRSNSPSMYHFNNQSDRFMNDPDSSDPVVVLNVNNSSHHYESTNGGGLSMRHPTNPLSAMYGSNDGMPNLDSINNFLPRPHTMASPSPNTSKNSHPQHHHQMRGRSSTNSPSLFATSSSSSSQAAASAAVAAPSGTGAAASVAFVLGDENSSPSAHAPSSSSLENGALGSGYKVLAKQPQQPPQLFSPPPPARLQREWSDSLLVQATSSPLALGAGAITASPPVGIVDPQQRRQQQRHQEAGGGESGVDPESHSEDLRDHPPVRIQLFDGIQTYTKSSIISHEKRNEGRGGAVSGGGWMGQHQHPARRSADDLRLVNGNYSESDGNGSTNILTTTATNNNNNRWQSMSVDMGDVSARAHAATSASINTEFAFPSQEGPQRYRDQPQSQSQSHKLSQLTQERGRSPSHSPSKKHPLPGGGNEDEEGKEGEEGAAYDGCEPAVAAEVVEEGVADDQHAYDDDYAEHDAEHGFADPLEVFACLDRTWHVYVTEEENHVYYLDMEHEHSQWEDPRVEGLIFVEDYDGSSGNMPKDSPMGNKYPTLEPPKSPSPSPKLDRTSPGSNLSSGGNSPRMVRPNLGAGAAGAGGGRGGGRSRFFDGAESPRVAGIKPTRIDWGEEGGEKEEQQGSGRSSDLSRMTSNESAFSRGQNQQQHQRRRDRHHQQRQESKEFSSSDSSEEDEFTSAVKVRYAHQSQQQQQSSSIENSKENGVDDGGVVMKKKATASTAENIEVENVAHNINGSNSSIAEGSNHARSTGRVQALLDGFEKISATSPTAAAASSLAPPPPPPASTSPLSLPEQQQQQQPTRGSDAEAAEAEVVVVVAAAAAVEQNEEEESEAKEAELVAAYIRMVQSGKTLQDIGELMTTEGRSQKFKLRVLALVDEAIILGPKMEGASMDTNSSTTQTSKSDNKNSNGSSSSGKVEETETVAMLKEDGVLKKYAKMIAMGVPPINVQAKMKMESVPVAQRNRLMRAAGHPEELDPTASTASAASADINSSSVVETIAMLKEDSILRKYAKMVAMGVPPANVQAKMKMDDISILHRNRLMRAAGHEEEPDPTGSGSCNSSAPLVGISRRPSAPMQNLHWNTIPADRLQNSIWSLNRANNSATSLGSSASNGATSTHGGAAAADMAEAELIELERLFGHASNGSAGGGSGANRTQVKEGGGAGSSFATTRNIGALAEKNKAALKLHLLEKRRAQNIVIGLNPFKSFCATHVDLLKALCSLNDLQGKITADHIDNFRNLLPTDAEMKCIDKIEGSSHPAELFFQAVMRFYPELPRRLSCFSSCLNFHDNCGSALERSKTIINSCNQVLSSNNLAKLLQRMLVVGNIMNEGTRRGGASGFTLDSLLKMVNTKGVDKKTSVLDYVVKSFYDKQEESVLSVIEDLSLVTDSSKISGKDVVKELSALRTTLTSLENAYAENKRKHEAEPTFHSPTAKQMIDDFGTKLETYMASFQGKMLECDKYKIILERKMVDIVTYFGEETDSTGCDTMKIFNVLQEFLTALSFSKAAVEWKIYRSQSTSG